MISLYSCLTGIVKTLWLHTWVVQNTLRKRTKDREVPRELDTIHQYLRNVCPHFTYLIISPFAHEYLTV